MYEASSLLPRNGRVMHCSRGVHVSNNPYLCDESGRLPRRSLMQLKESIYRESIYIKNVGPISELDIDDIRPLTLLIGASAAGKSTLMKVLALMRYIYKMENIHSFLLDSNIPRSPFRLEFKNLLKDGLRSAVSKDSEIVYTVTFPTDTNLFEEAQYVISYRGGKLDNRIHIQTKHLSFFKEAYMVEERGAMPTLITGRSSARSELGFYFNETLSDLQDALQALPEIDLTHVGFHLATRRSGNKLRYIIAGTSEGVNKSEVELKYASSGIQTSMPLVALLRYFAQKFSFRDALSRSILSYLYNEDALMSFHPVAELGGLPRHAHLYIEEPELNLFPTAQCALLDLAVREAFIGKATDRRLSLMVATHSPYIANYINVLLRRSRRTPSELGLREEDFAVYLIEGGKIHSLVGEDEMTGERVVDTQPLTNPMEDIYNAYVELE